MKVQHEKEGIVLSRIFKLLIFVLLMSSASHSTADWINLTGAENSRNIAEIYVEKDRVTVKLEIYVEDLLVFEELRPEVFFPASIAGRPPVD